MKMAVVVIMIMMMAMMTIMTMIKMIRMTGVVMAMMMMMMMMMMYFLMRFLVNFSNKKIMIFPKETDLKNNFTKNSYKLIYFKNNHRN